MNWQPFFGKGKSDIVLGLELGTESFAYVLMQAGKVHHVLMAREEKLPTDAVGNFLLTAEVVKKALWDCPYRFSGLAVATGNLLMKSLPLKNVGDKEIVNILKHEMQVSWGLKSEEYQFSWCPGETKNGDLQIGLLERGELQNYLHLAKLLGTDLLAVTGVQPVQFDDGLVFDDGYRDEAEKAALESNYCGAIHGALVAVQAVTDVNFLQMLHTEQQQSRYAKFYLLTAKGVAGFVLLVLAGAGIFYGVSCYKLRVAEKNLQGIKLWSERYDDCCRTSNRIGSLQKQVTGVDELYKFCTPMVEKILDAMPEYNNEIFRLRTEKDGGNKLSSKIIVEGRVQDNKQLRFFLNALKKTGDFSKVDLISSRQTDSAILDYSISLQLGRDR